MFGTKHSKTNWLQKTIEYQTNELNAKYFKLKCEYIKLSNVFKYNQVNLVLAVFASS